MFVIIFDLGEVSRFASEDQRELRLQMTSADVAIRTCWSNLALVFKLGGNLRSIRISERDSNAFLCAAKMHTSNQKAGSSRIGCDIMDLRRDLVHDSFSGCYVAAAIINVLTGPKCVLALKNRSRSVCHAVVRQGTPCGHAGRIGDPEVSHSAALLVAV